jgi:aryl-alcohol dehydrogenase-like predicted oxidoreductase
MTDTSANVSSAPPFRRLGPDGPEVSAIGFGAWAIGGPASRDGRPIGWGEVDDDESVAAIHAALDAGITFFDTANVYGAGHSERVLNRALAGRREQVVIATKFGNVIDEEKRIAVRHDTSPEQIREQCDGSLSRLGTDYLDLYQLHVGDLPLDQVDGVLEVLEELVAAGKIRAYGWSTDDPARAAVFAAGEHCAVVQHRLNVLQDAPELLALCAESNLASVNRSPLAMGLLTGKRAAGQALEAGDIRSAPPAWLPGFTAATGADPAWLARVDALRSVLTSSGRTLAQGALAWLWARSPHTVPIPGFRTVAQAEENAAAIIKGPLTPDQLTEIDGILGR